MNKLNLMRTPLTATSICIGLSAMAQFGPYTPFAPSATTYQSARLVDLDDDGDMDVLEYRASTAGFAGLLLWRSNDGSGTFSEPMPFEGLGSSIVESLPGVADLNADGKPDLIGAFSVAEVKRWFMNAGGGVFVPMPVIEGSAGFPDSRAFDVDQDGDLDLLFYGTGYSVNCALNSDGAGTFDPASEAADLPTTGLDMGDIDNDGDLDLAISSQLGPVAYIQIFRQTSPGVFGPDISPSNPALAPWGVAWLDMDGDGDVDPTVTGGVGIDYYPYDGADGFLPVVSTGMQTGPLRGWSRLDLEGDGDMDLVAAAAGKLVWVEELSPGSFVTHYSSDLVATIEQTSVEDIDGDSDRDVLALSRSGRLLAWNEMEAGAFGEWHILFAEPAGPADVHAADADGDGDQDAFVAAVTNGVIGWYGNSNGAGAFGPFNFIRTEADSVLAIDAGDLDGDGDMDIVSAEAGHGQLNWMENNGDGTAWTLHSLATGLARPNTVRIVDLANDGYPDILFTTHADEALQVCWNNGGSFSAPEVIGNIGARPSSMFVADVNHDSQWDVLISAIGTGFNGVVQFKGTPDGLAFAPMQVVTSGLTNPVQIWVQDVDEDTHPDLFYIHENSGRVFRLNGDGTGGFCCAVPMTAASLGIRKMLLADFDGDAYYDMAVMRSGNNGLLYYHGQGGGSFGPVVIPIATPFINGVDLTTFDKDADGDPDMLLCHTSSYQVGVITNYYGSAYRISGRLFLDLDGDGVYGTGDLPAPFIPVISTPSISNPFADPEGNYQFYLPEGSYAVQAPNVAPCWALSTAASVYNETLTAAQPIASGRDFGYGIACDTTVIEVTRSHGNICAGTRTITFNLYNNGTTVTNGLLRVVLDPLTAFVSSNPPAALQNGDTVWVDAGTIGHFDLRSVKVVIIGPGAGNLGDTLRFAATYFAEDAGGAPLGDFGIQWERPVLCAYDPNDKHVEPAGIGAGGYIPVGTERLTYRIRFQNTGNADAEHVRLLDQLSEALDISTLQMLAWSHPFTLQVEPDRTARFEFEDIALPPASQDSSGSQGFVIFSVGLVPGLAAGTAIENTAGIYFDLNPAIITNTTVNTLFDCNLAQANVEDLGSGLLLANVGEAYQWLLDGAEIPGATDQAFTATLTGSYSVVITDSLGCTPSSEEVFVLVTGLATNETTAMRVHPSPFTASTSVVLPASVKLGGTMEITDALGRVIDSISIGSIVVMIAGEGLPPGLLHLRYIEPDGSARIFTRVLHLD